MCILYIKKLCICWCLFNIYIVRYIDCGTTKKSFFAKRFKKSYLIIMADYNINLVTRKICPSTPITHSLYSKLVLASILAHLPIGGNSLVSTSKFVWGKICGIFPVKLQNLYYKSSKPLLFLLQDDDYVEKDIHNIHKKLMFRPVLLKMTLLLIIYFLNNLTEICT